MPPQMQALYLPPFMPPAELIDGEVESDAEFLFVDAGLVDMAGHAEELGAGRDVRAHGS